MTSFSHKGFEEEVINDFDLISLKVDYYLSKYIYFPGQLSMAYGDVRGNPGYGELMTGLGLKGPKLLGLIEPFVQVTGGVNAWGLIVKPELGMSIKLKHNVSFITQYGWTRSLNQLIDGSKNLLGDKQLEAESLSFGVSIKFSLFERH